MHVFMYILLLHVVVYVGNPATGPFGIFTVAAGKVVCDIQGYTAAPLSSTPRSVCADITVCNEYDSQRLY